MVTFGHDHWSQVFTHHKITRHDSVNILWPMLQCIFGGSENHLSGCFRLFAPKFRQWAGTYEFSECTLNGGDNQTLPLVWTFFTHRQCGVLKHPLALEPPGETFTTLFFAFTFCHMDVNDEVYFTVHTAVVADAPCERSLTEPH